MVNLLACYIIFSYFYTYSVQQSSSAPEPAYELMSKPNDDDVNVEKNPAYSAVQDTPLDHQYEFIAGSNHTKAKQWFSLCNNHKNY